MLTSPQNYVSCLRLSSFSSGSGMWRYGLDRAGSGYGQVAGTCECGNEASGSIKYGEFLDQLQTG